MGKPTRKKIFLDALIGRYSVGIFLACLYILIKSLETTKIIKKLVRKRVPWTNQDDYLKNLAKKCEQRDIANMAVQKDR